MSEFSFEDLFHGNGSGPNSKSLPNSYEATRELIEEIEEDIGSKTDVEQSPAPARLRNDESSAVEPLSLTSDDNQSGSAPKETVPLSRTMSRDSFVFLKLIGKGGFGKVHQVMKKDTGQIFAVKSLSKKHLIDTNSVENTIAECDILRKVTHPFIVRLHYAFQTETKLYLVMDFVNGGHVLYHLNREAMFTEVQARFYLAEAVLSIEHLHSQDIIHRDLKPENVLLDSEGHIVLTDFGFAKEKVTNGEAATSFCGTYEYMAPEVILKNKYGKPADCWALGILLYDLLRGHPPFQHDNDAQLFRKILNDKLKMPKYWAPTTCDLLRGLMQRDVKKRYTIPRIKSHQFFKKIDWDKLARKEIEPPIRPVVPEGINDVSNFDAELTKQPPPGCETPISPVNAQFQAMFKGFSYSRSPIIPL